VSPGSPPETQPPEAQPPPGVETTAPPVKSHDVEGAVTNVEMADVYRSLVTSLRDKLGGTITNANADAIARAAAQVYRQEVEPRLWEEKSAHELLDGLGVPRSGAFVPYSLSDRLMLLRRSGAEDPYRAYAHELLDRLGVPRGDEAGHEYPLQGRLTRLLGSLDDGGGTGGTGGGPGDGSNSGEGAEGEADAGPGATDEAGAGPDLVDALEAIHRAVGPADEEVHDVSPPPTPPTAPAPPAPDLIGLGSLLGTIQEELLEVRQTVESLRQELRDAVALFQAGAGAGAVPPVVPGVPLAEAPEIVVRRVDEESESGAPEAGAPAPDAGAPAPDAGAPAPDAPTPAAGPDFAPPGSGSPNGEGRETDPPDTALETPGPNAEAGLRGPNAEAGPEDPSDPSVPGEPAGPHDPTRVLPAVPLVADGPQLVEEAGAEEPATRPRRSRRFVLLLLLVLLIGALLAAGITAAIVLGWDELESRLRDTVSAPALRSGALPAWSGGGAAP
jgi:hypothetical protein